MKFGVVVIGRNEGERLRKCLEALSGLGVPMVYVDSGSQDGSDAIARKMGVEVLGLDARMAFTAARARNEGLRRLRELAPELDYVQFVDGDCELSRGWLHKAAAFLDAHENVAAVCGRLREKYPERTIYNKLCDIEWDRPAGEAKACGGIAMMRIRALESVRGFRADLIAGEEPELCVRLRASGWRIWRLSEEMAWHDASIARFGQWWRRMLRTGYAFAQGAHLHGAPPERHGVRESRSAWFWALGIPLAVLVGAAWLGAWALVALLLYPLQIARLALRGERSARENWLHAAFLVLGKFPEMLGQMKFLLSRHGEKAQLIEYKTPAAASSPVASSRVSYLINQYPKVSHSFIRREIQALERQGFQVQRIALRGWDGELVDEEDRQERRRTQYVLQSGIVALTWSLLRGLFSAPLRFAAALGLALRMARRADRPLPYHLACLAEACRMMPWVEAFGATHLHAHFGTNAAEVVMLAHALGGPPYSFTVHGPEEFDKPQFLGIGEKVRHAAFVIAISSYAQSQLFRWVAHAHWSRIQVVHCGLDPAFYALEPTPPAGKPRLVCIGRLCEQKGQLLLIEAARRLAAKGVRFELVLVGDGEIRAEVEELIAKHGLGEQVRMTGVITTEQLRQEILSARALVLPSFAEGLPMVIMEAMALRRPVLSTYVAGIPELVRDGKNGWLFPAGSVDALTAAIEDCLCKPVEELRAMGEAAYQRVLERHSIDVEVAKLARLFKESTRAHLPWRS